jgi:hypothetical protein
MAGQGGGSCGDTVWRTRPRKSGNILTDINKGTWLRWSVALPARRGRATLQRSHPKRSVAHLFPSIYLRKSQLWSEDFTAKLFCDVEFWFERLPRLIGLCEITAIEIPNFWPDQLSHKHLQYNWLRLTLGKTIV